MTTDDQRPSSPLWNEPLRPRPELFTDHPLPDVADDNTVLTDEQTAALDDAYSLLRRIADRTRKDESV